MGERVTVAARFAVRCALFAIVALASACQSVTFDEALDVGETAAPGTETVGSGPVTIGMLTTLSGDKADRDRRDGAKFAAVELGRDQVTLALYNAEPSATGLAAGVDALLERDARVIIGPSQADQLNSVVKVPDVQEIPVLALVSNDAPTGDGVFSFVSDEVDSAIEAAAYAVEAGRKRVLVVHAPNIGKTAIERLRKGIETKGGSVSASVPFAAQAGGQIVVEDSVLQASDAVLLAPGLADPSAALAALRATGALASDVTILGTGDWSREQLADPSLAGALSCRFQRQAIRDLDERYRERFGRPMSAAAIYGFDAVALAVGIVRAHGADKLTAATLRSPTGFSGLLGAFRFNSSGNIERSCSIFRVEDGKLRLQDPAPAGF